ncbi:MAG TPA: hypothetical protein VIK51_06790 [Vicinamibacteria bacterium]|jgi:hypothetical protein
MNEEKKDYVDPEGYRRSVAYGMGVALTLENQRKVKGGPEHLAVFSGQKVSWNFLNTTGTDATFVLTVQKGGSPDHPFVEPPPWKVPAGRNLGKATLTLTIKTFKEAAHYKYQIEIEGEKGSALDPELDIWP